MNKELNNLAFPSYFKYQKSRLAQVAKVLILVGCLYVFSFLFYDYVMFQDDIVFIAVMRFLVVASLLSVYSLYSKWNNEKHFSFVSVNLTLLSFILFFYMNLVIEDKNPLLVLVIVYYLMASLSLSPLIEKKHFVYGALVITFSSYWLMSQYMTDVKLFKLLITHIASLSVFTVLVSFKFINSAKESYEIAKKSHRLQFQDALTDVYNRKGIISWCKEHLDNKKPDENFSLIMIDLDCFKNVNDLYGHAMGDEVIAKIAGLIKTELGNSSEIGRLGGEEFLVAFSDMENKEVELVALRLLNKVRSLVFNSDAKKTFKMTASLGVAHHQGESFRKLLAAADKFMYLAKNNGRNQVVTQQIATQANQSQAHTSTPAL